MKQKITIKLRGGSSKPVQYSFGERLIFFVVLLVIVFGATTLIFAWSNPTVAPPGGNLSGFLNTGSTAQTKSGALTIATSTYLATTGGNVGIGTTAPGSLLHVAKSQNAETAITINNPLNPNLTSPTTALIFSGFRDIDSNLPLAKIQAVHLTTAATLASKADLAFYTTTDWNSLTEKMRITTAGNVGIGTTSPGALLDIEKAGGSANYFNIGNAGGTNVFTVGSWGNITTGRDLQILPGGFANVTDVRLRVDSASGQTGHMLDVNSYGNTGGNLFTVLANGNVGIGTTAPGTNAKLHVVGDIIGNAQVFRAYMTSSWSASGSWIKMPFDATLFNTLQGTFSTANNRFTASRAGYYQISVTGFSATPSTGHDRYAIAAFKNGANEGFAGSNYSAGDTPLVGPTMIVYLNGSTDYVEIWAFSAILATWVGGSSGGHVMFWYMNYLGT